MKIIIISEVIAPVSAIGSVRWTKLGKYLKKNHNAEIDILTTKKHYRDEPGATYRRFDKTLASDLRYFGKELFVPESIAIRMIDYFFRAVDSLLKARVAISGSNEKEDSASSGDGHTSVFFKAYGKALEVRGWFICRAIKRMKIDWGFYDVVVSSFSPSWVHYAAREVKKSNPSIKWVADYRDPTTGIVDVPGRLKKDYPKIVTGIADIVVAASEGTMQSLALPAYMKKLVITNGFDPDEMTERKRRRTDKFIISYTGTLYAEGERLSDLTPLFGVLEELIRQGIVEKEDILVSYAGKSSDLFCGQADSFRGVPSVDNGFLSREEALRIQESSSLLILAAWNTEETQGVIPAKIFEYYCSGVPVVGLCSGGLAKSIGKEMIEESGFGYCFEEAGLPESRIELKLFLEKKYHEWKRWGLTECEKKDDYVNNFSSEKLADKLYSALSEKR